MIHPTALIHHKVIIEGGVHIGPYCVIGFSAEWKGKEDNEGKVIIKSGTRITGLVTIDSGTDKPTIIGKNCYLLKKSHVGHDAELKDNVTLSCNAIVGGHTIVGNNCNIGLGAILHQKIIIPDYVMIGMGGIVTKKSSLESFKTYAGNPVKCLGDNKYLIEKYQKEYDWYLQNRISEQ